MPPRTRKSPSFAAANKTDLTVETWPIDRVRPYATNPRRNDGAVEKVATSLREFGWRQPIVVDASGVVIVGHTRLKAAQQLGYAEVPVHVAIDLADDKARAYRLADNRTGEEAEWDFPLLGEEIGALRSEGLDLGMLGFDVDELSTLFAPESGIVDGADVEDAPPLPATAKTALGDRIQLGRHVLVCGDATDAAAWAALLGEENADLVWTDPPYGVSYVGGTADALTIDNDDLSVEGLEALLAMALGIALSRTKPGGAWYVAAPPGPQFLAFAKVLAALDVWRQTLVWVKHTFALGRSDYHYRHEAIFAGERPVEEDAEDPLADSGLDATPIVAGWRAGAGHTWNGGRKQDTVLEYPKPTANRLHPTMKPVALVQRCIENSSSAGAVVVDPFGGSGSTLIAAEASGRSARLLELSPQYCDVIVERWEQVTGQTAVRP